MQGNRLGASKLADHTNVVLKVFTHSHQFMYNFNAMALKLYMNWWEWVKTFKTTLVWSANLLAPNRLPCIVQPDRCEPCWQVRNI